MDDSIIPISQIPVQKILKNEGSEVADVSVIVDCRTAGVKPNHAFFQGMEFFIRATEGIVQFEHNSSPE